MNRRINDSLRTPRWERSGWAIAALVGWMSLVPVAAQAEGEPDASANPTPEGAAVAAEKPATSDVAAPPANDLTYTRESYYYAATGLRDPFGSLVSGRFVSDDSKRLPDVGSMNLLGVMWGDSDKFGLVEDQEGNGFVLRVGDPVINGEVAGITRESLSVRQHFFGSSTTVTLKLKPKEEKGHASKKRR